jgi:hypothetical protein
MGDLEVIMNIRSRLWRGGFIEEIAGENYRWKNEWRSKEIARVRPFLRAF